MSVDDTLYSGGQTATITGREQVPRLGIIQAATGVADELPFLIVERNDVPAGQRPLREAQTRSGHVSLRSKDPLEASTRSRGNLSQQQAHYGQARVLRATAPAPDPTNSPDPSCQLEAHDASWGDDTSELTENSWLDCELT